jgi:hypothetical protein
LGKSEGRKETKGGAKMKGGRSEWPSFVLEAGKRRGKLNLNYFERRLNFNC